MIEKLKKNKLLRKIYKAVKPTPKTRDVPTPEPKPAQPQSQIERKTYTDSPKTVAELRPEYCSGCGACANVCPVDAITMTRDAEGYLRPEIDEKKCVNCNKCANICPVINTMHENSAEPDCYAVMASDEVRRNSSSGGAFTLLAEYVFNKGGYVCGAAFDESFTVKHIIIDNPGDLHKLRGSKYVQSHTGEVFRQIKGLLAEGKYVLFSGCPCQVAGLNGFLGKKYTNLLTVDLVCHGGPSQMVFDRYIEDNYGKENLRDFKFRTKEYGYNSFNQIAYMKDGRKIAGNFAFDAYEKCMHTGLAAKEICANCPFAPAPRQGDITIGDFWGISKYNSQYNDGLGTSVLLVNNQQGKIVWEAVRPNCKLAEPVPFDVARHNNRFGSRMGIPSGRDFFFKMLKSKPFDNAVDYALNRKFDVGVVGLWYGLNYGSMATYYALHHTLQEMGLSVLMIENSLRPDDENTTTKTHPRRIGQQFYEISRKYPLHDLKILNQHCDTFMVGADQLWNVDLSRQYRQAYFLDFVDDNKKKISVGTSFGKEYHGTAEEKLISSHNLQRFDHVSVRDELSKNICKDFGVDSTVICDPAMFCSSEAYEPIASQAELEHKEKYILAYILDPNEAIGEFLHEMAVAKNCKVYVVLDLYPPLWEERRKNLNVDDYDEVEVKTDVDLCEWLWYYKNSEAVITDSFHGTIFSILYQKPFIARSNHDRGAERFVSLLKPLALKERLFEDFRDIDDPVSMLDSLDYTIPNKRVEEARKYALDWLKQALYAPKKIKSKAIYEVFEKEETK